uniref:Receptor expression-enhancing protein 6 n=1 Tax=Cebus imitator TaxID=2715852 RepID=A0A2K5QR41_CEBIM
MRRGRRGRPHLLCPPCPPIGPGGGPGADTGAGPGPRGSRCGKAARVQRGVRAGPRASSSSQPRARRGHGRAEPARGPLPGAEEPGHRRAGGAGGQDRGGEAVPGCRSRYSAKPVSAVRLRSVSAVQSHRICIPRICFNQSYREPKQGRRHCVAHLLGGVRSVQPGRVLQRHTPVLVPFLLRGQVRLPVVLHGSQALERGSHAVPPRRAPAVSKAPRGRGQNHEQPQQASPGHGGRNNQEREAKPDPATEGQVKQPLGPCKDLLAGEKGAAPGSQPSTESSADSQPAAPASASGPGRAQRVSLNATSEKPQPQISTTSSGSQDQLPSGSAAGSCPSRKAQGQRRAQGNSRQPQPRTQPPRTSPSQVAVQSPGPLQQPNVTSSPASPGDQPPGSTNSPMQPPSKPPSEPEDAAPKTTGQTQKQSLKEPASGASVREVVPCHSESSLEYTSESATEITCSWPHRLRCLQHYWRLKHLAC